MIDTVHLKAFIFLEDLNLEKWTAYSIIDKETGEIIYTKYYTFIKSVFFSFSPRLKKLKVSGRLINLIEDSKVLNFDDIYNSENIEDFFSKANESIGTLFKDIEIDIRDFEVTRIDYCLNIYTEYVDKYVIFLNNYYQKVQNNKLRNYKNFAIEHDKLKHSSFYLKSNGQYKGSKKQIFSLNFYNKQNQIFNKYIKRNIKNKKQLKDLEDSKNVFRLEIQCYYQLVKSICKKYKISPYCKRIIDFFNIDIAREVIASKIKSFIGTENFYSYKSAKEIIQSSNLKYHTKEDLLTYIRQYNNNEVALSDKHTKKLKAFNIFPYYFIPKSWNIDTLDNPIQLIECKVNQFKNNG